MARSETVVYKGIRFRRWPDSDRRTERVYFTPGVADRQRGVKRLHEEIWQDHNGREIPEGHDVHHADHDPLNNDPGNLALLTGSEHRSHHAADGPREFSEATRAAAAEWHRTAPEAAELHRANGYRTWEGREPAERTCERCGQPYQSRAIQQHDRFCSNRCRAAARRASGVDDVDRTCQRCGNGFRVNRYAKTRYCSRSCAARR